MKIETLDVHGFMPALHGMRNPMNSWEKGDSKDGIIGENDKNLSLRLQRSGPEHCKHLRMIVVWADIYAPRYWWQEMDTYRNGVEKVSCSTMHTIVKHPFTVNDFESGYMDDISTDYLEASVARMNELREQYNNAGNDTEKKEAWYRIICELPQSYIQKRTVMLSYAALRNIYRQRKGHKLKEWGKFRRWVEGLPESWMITDIDDRAEACEEV